MLKAALWLITQLLLFVIIPKLGQVKQGQAGQGYRTSTTHIMKSGISPIILDSS